MSAVSPKSVMLRCVQTSAIHGIADMGLTENAVCILQPFAVGSLPVNLDAILEENWMLGISKAILDLVQFGHQVKSSADTTRLLEELNETAKSVDHNMAQILLAQEQFSVHVEKPANPTLAANGDRAAAFSENAAKQGLEAKDAIDNARRQYNVHLNEAENLIASTSLAELKDQVPDPSLQLIDGFKVVNHKVLGQLARFQAVSDTEMIVVITVALENGWVVVCQEGTETKRSIMDPSDQRVIYEDTQGTIENLGKFAMSKLVSKDGTTANFSTGRNPGGSTYPSTESESYYFSGDLRNGPEAVVGVSISHNDSEEFEVPLVS